MTSTKVSLFKKIGCIAVTLLFMMSFSISVQASAPAYIGESKAKAIALNHAVLTEEEVMFDKLTLYNKNRTWIYDIEFLSTTTEYTYEINAISGDVIACYLEDLHHSVPQQLLGSNNSVNSVVINNDSTGSGQYIGFEKAKTIAFNHAGVSANDVRKLETELDEHDHRMIYEIEFVSSGMEYEYEIYAVTGDIRLWESERD